MIVRKLWPAAMAAALFVGVAVAKDDGKKEEHIEYSAVPEVVRQAFEKDYPGVKLKHAEKETYSDGTIHYEFEFHDASGKKIEVEYNADGEKLDDHEDDGDKKKSD